MGAVEFVVNLEQQMELVPLKRGWWVAFGGPRQASGPAAAPAAARPVPEDASAEPLLDAPAAPSRSRERGRAGQRNGTIPPSEPKRRQRREPHPPSPRPMPDPAPPPVPDPPATPDMPPTPRDSRGGRR